MLPDEAANAAVLWDCFEGAVGGLVSRCGTSDGDIVNVGDRVLGNLRLKDVHHVVVEDGDRVSPTHREFGETEGAVWCLESGVVVGCFGESAFIVSDVQVEHSSAGTTCELLGDLFGEGGDTGVLDCDGVEGFETVDRTNGVGFFLCYAEPVRAVRGVRPLVYASVHLCPNNFANLIVDTQRYRNVLLNPGGVRDDGDFDRREEVLAEVTAFGVVPSEPFILDRHEMVKEVTFGGPEKARRMKVVGLIAPLIGVATTGCEQWKDRGNGQDVGEWVSDDVSLNAKF